MSAIDIASTGTRMTKERERIANTNLHVKQPVFTFGFRARFLTIGPVRTDFIESSIEVSTNFEMMRLAVLLF
jgi:hypothetical protein